MIKAREPECPRCRMPISLSLGNDDCRGCGQSLGFEKHWTPHLWKLSIDSFKIQAEPKFPDFGYALNEQVNKLYAMLKEKEDRYVFTQLFMQLTDDLLSQLHLLIIREMDRRKES